MEWIRTLAPGEDGWPAHELTEKAVGDPALVSRAVEVLGPMATAWAVQVAHRAASRVRVREEESGFPVSASIGRDRQASEEAFLRLMIGLATGSQTELLAELSESLVDIVHAESRHGVPLDALLNRVWGVHSMAKDELTSAMQHTVSPQRQAQVLSDLSLAMLDYANVFVRRVASAYEKEQRAWRGRRADEQLRILAAVAEGAQPPPRCDGVVEASWAGGHLFAIGWADRDEYIADDERDIAQYMTASTAALSADHGLTLERGGQIFLWWNFAGGLPATAAPSLAGTPQPAWLRLAVGPPGTGLTGFRDAWHGAHLAAMVGRRAVDGVTWHYEDVGHLALMLDDRARAAWFVRRELGPLGRPGVRIEEIRDTVRLYLASGNSRITVAGALHIAPNTVAYRVAQANEMLGYPVGERPLQILLALQLADVVPDLLR